MKSAVEIILPTLEERRDAAQRMLGITPLIDVKQLTRATEEGFLNNWTVLSNRQPVFSIWTNLSCDGGLHVNAAVALTTHTDINELDDALEMLARDSRAKYIRFNTDRAGLLTKGRKLGYKAVAVCMVKTL